MATLQSVLNGVFFFFSNTDQCCLAALSVYCHVHPKLLDGLDLLQRNTLSSLKQEFIAHSVIGTYRNLTGSDFAR